MNAYGMLVSESNPLSANQDLQMVMFTHRKSANWTFTGGNSGSIQHTFTTDNGATWDSTISYVNGTFLGRYPQGQIFNPAGNTNPQMAYAAATGPVVTSSWEGNFVTSIRLDSTNGNQAVYNLTSNNSPIQALRYAMSSTDLGVYSIGGLYDDYAGWDMTRGFGIMKGAWNGTNGFTWTIDSINLSFMTGPSYEYSDSPMMAWSQDGMTGYVVFIGVPANATVGAFDQTYTARVFKSTDAGTTWTMMPAFDYATIPSIDALLYTTNTGTNAKAFFNTFQGGADAAVDLNGNLHIFTGISSAYSNHPDSLGYTVSTGSITYLYDVFTTGTGWDAHLVDSLQTDYAYELSPIEDAGSTGTYLTFPVYHRLGLSRTKDGQYMIFNWVDTDPMTAPSNTAGSLENTFPNIHSKGLNVSTNMWTPTTIMTTEEDYFFTYHSPTALVSGSTIKVPTTFSFGRTGSDIAGVYDHYYVDGVQFDVADFTLTSNNSVAASAVETLKMVPNPASTQTSVNFNLKSNENVVLTVSNVMGQTVAVTEGNYSAGNHIISVSTEGLEKGIYLVTLTSGTTKTTGKLVIK